MPLCKWSKDGICTTYRWKGGDPLKCPARTIASCLGLIDELEDILIDPRLRQNAKEKRERRQKYALWGEPKQIKLGEIRPRLKDFPPQDCIIFQKSFIPKGYQAQKNCLLKLGIPKAETPCQGDGRKCVWRGSER